MSAGWLRSSAEVAAAAVGLLAGHQLTYALVTADAHEAERLWVLTGHATVSPVRVALAFAFAVAVHICWQCSRFVVIARGVGCQVGLQVLAFVSLEQVERATVGAAVWERPWLLSLGIATQIVVAAGIIALREGLGLLIAVVRHLGPSWGAAELSLGRPHGEVVLPLQRWLVRTRPTRGPPASLMPL